MSELETKAKVLRALGISETRVSELLGDTETYPLGTTPSQDKNSVGELQENIATAEAKTIAEVEEESLVSPIIWETGNVSQLRSTLVWKEAEVIRLRVQLTGNPTVDWYALNQIRNLEGHIADIRRWLAEAEKA